MSNLFETTDPRCIDLPLPVAASQGDGLPVVEGGACGPVFTGPLLPLALAAALHACVLALLVSLGMGAGISHGVICVSLLPAGSLAGPAAGPDAAGAAAGVAAVRQPSSDLGFKGGREEAVSSATNEIGRAKPVSQESPACPKIAAKPPKTRVKAEKRTTVKARKAVSEPAAQPSALPPSAVARSGIAEAGPGRGVEANATALAGPGGSLAAAAAPGGGGTGSGGSAAGAGIGTGPVSAGFGTAGGPRFVRRVLPQYPELARRRGREGRVVLRLVIGTGGELKDVEVVEGVGHGFEEAALAAVRASEYAPAVRGGRAVECAALLPIRFSLRGS